MTIRFNDFDKLHPEPGGAHRYTAEASELGLRPGEWPDAIQASIGNGQPFVLKSIGQGGAWYRYYQVCGCIDIRIFND